MNRKFLVTSFWSCLVLILLLFSTLAFSHHFPLRLSSPGMRANAHNLLVISIPISILIARYLRFLISSKKRNIAVTTVSAVLVSILGFLFAAALNFFSITWIDEQLLYKSRINDKQVIQQISSWTFDSRRVEITPTILGLEKVMLVDKIQLDKSDWQEVSTEEGYIAW